MSECSQSYNDTIFPLVEFWWDSETYDNDDVYFSGMIKGRFLLPIKFDGNFNLQRRIAAAFMRFLGAGQHNLFKRVLGLIEIGAGISFQYDQIFVADGIQCPAITFRMPFKYDLRVFTRAHADVDYKDRLDADLIGMIESYGIEVKDEEGDVLIAEGTLSVTGQTNS